MTLEDPLNDEAWPRMFDKKVATAMMERSAIVAWLREFVSEMSQDERWATCELGEELLYQADLIERGEHLKGQVPITREVQMIKMRLLTRGNELVTEVEIPSFQQYPEVLVWGQRVFASVLGITRSGLPLFYQEVAVYHVVPVLKEEPKV